MARSGKTAQEFIQTSFSPIVAVLCSNKVESAVLKNNLSFTELLQPFSTVDSEGQFREPGGSVCIIKNWKLILRDVNWKPLQPTEARRQLNNAVLHNFNDRVVSLDIDGKKFDIPQSTPWFDAWREAYLDVQFPSDHEFTKHFLSCIIVATTLDENIIDTFNGLNQQYAQLQNVTPHKLPKWFNAGVLKSYLLLHDPSTVSKDKADSTFEILKQSFGAMNCFMLTINSRTSTDPLISTDYWTPFIKRFQSNTELSSTIAIQQSPSEPTPAYATGVAVVTDAGEPTIPNIPTESSHPLTQEHEMYDQANSLQTHSFSGSIESVHVLAKNMDVANEVHGTALNANDVESIKKFMQEYAFKALLPYLEKQIAQLSEVVANRKGVSRSLLSATKRWFGTGKGGNTTGNNTVIYTTDCPELQLRRLGDLWFMTGQWQRAFDAYHMAKREFYADSAWLCYAGALEMAAISAFMSGDTNRKMPGYMEESIVTYLNTCRMVQYAVRATLLSALCLSSQGLHGEAAKQLIRMTSEDSDLRSAMLLEQASLSFLSGPGSKAMSRKYAFHMVLAGHRFSKAGQKKHAYRCYQQAYQVYKESGWRLSTDHVQFAVGRLAGSLRLHAAAVHWLAAPLAPAAACAPRQPPAQQHAFLREYMLHHQQWMENSGEFKECLPVLPLPIIELESTAVLCVGPAPLSSPARTPATSITFQDNMSVRQPSQDEKCWNKMEEMLLQVVQGSVPMIFKPTIDLYTAATDTHPVVHRGEPVQISITVRNPLKIALLLRDVQLLWSFVPEENTEGSNEVLSNEAVVAAGNVLESSVIHGQKIKCVLLEGDTKKTLIFALTPLHAGEINIQALAYKLINMGEGGNENTNGITISGKIHLSGDTLIDKRIKIRVVPSAPCLQMTFSETNPDIISGEMRSIDVEFRNVGPVDMINLYIAVSHPDCIHLVSNEQNDDTFKALYDEKYRGQPSYSDERAARADARRRLSALHVSKCTEVLAAGGAMRATLLLRPRNNAHAIRLLAYYEPADRTIHRLLRHVFRFNVAEAVEISVTPRRNLKTVDEGIVENMNLVVEVKNIFKENGSNLTVEVVEAALLSRQWQLTNLTTARSIHDPLTSNEKLHLVLKSKRLTNPLPDGKVDSSYLKISDGHHDSSACIDSSPNNKFILDDKECYIEKTDYANDDIEHMNNKSTGLIQSMFVLRWKVKNNTNNTSAIGQHCLWMDCFTKASIEDEPSLSVLPEDLDNRIDPNESKKKKKDSIVLFKMEHPNQILHNFTERRLCLVPISINIVNCYGVPVDVSLDLSKQQNRSDFNSLGWTGVLGEGGILRVALERFESRRVEVRGLCAAPGTYVVGNGIISCRIADAVRPATVHHTSNTSLLVVQQV